MEQQWQTLRTGSCLSLVDFEQLLEDTISHFGQVPLTYLLGYMEEWTTMTTQQSQMYIANLIKIFHYLYQLGYYTPMKALPQILDQPVFVRNNQWSTKHSELEMGVYEAHLIVIHRAWRGVILSSKAKSNIVFQSEE